MAGKTQLPLSLIVEDRAFASSGLRISLRASVIAHVLQFRQTTCWKPESGGQLFAKIEQGRWIVSDVTGPRPNDIRSRFGYQPNRPSEQREIDEKFLADLHYVGDWHTHPQSRPKPSGSDIASMQAMVHASQHELPGFLMVIVGTAGLWASIHRRNGSWEELKQLET